MTVPSTIAIAPNITAYFQEVISDAIRVQQVEATEAATSYLVSLLCSFTHPDEEGGGSASRPLTFRLHDALQAPPAERFRRLRVLGDHALYTLGFFGDHIEQKGVDRGYVSSVGSTAYAHAAGMLRTRAAAARCGREGVPDVLSELAAKFDRFAAILADVADGTLACGAWDERSVVKLYERWLRTGLPSRRGTGRAWHRPHARSRRSELMPREPGPAEALSPARPSGLPARIQERLCRHYGIGDAPVVDAFIDAVDSGRETLLVRDAGGELEVRLCLPRAIVDGARPLSFDELCQGIEGVSHFLYLSERARRELPATRLELELQAEVDKYVLLAHAGTGFHPVRSAHLREQLFERVHYVHAADTETGARYRMANALAARFARRLEGMCARHAGLEPVRATLRRFYGAGQAEKIGLARAA